MISISWDHRWWPRQVDPGIWSEYLETGFVTTKGVRLRRVSHGAARGTPGYWMGDFEHDLKCCNLDRKVMLILESVKGGLDFLRQQCEVHCYICRNTFAASFRCISMHGFSFSPNFAWTYHTISQYVGSKRNDTEDASTFSWLSSAFLHPCWKISILQAFPILQCSMVVPSTPCLFQRGYSCCFWLDTAYPA